MSKPIRFDANLVQSTDKQWNSQINASGSLGSGWILSSDSNGISTLEVDNILARNSIRTHIFQKDVVKATNGQLYISDSAIIASIDSSSVTFKEDSAANFNENDILEVRDVKEDSGVINSVKFKITSGSGPSYDIEIEEGNVNDIEDGMTAVRISGNSILLDASTEHAPFIDFKENSNTKTRIGNLAGISSKNMSPSGYGLYSENVFLEGLIRANEGRIGDTTINQDGSITSAGEKFKINSDGSIESTEGKIANWDIESDKLSSGSTIIDSDGSIQNTNTNGWHLTKDGKLIAEDAEIGGKISATTGDIAGWNISGSKIESDNIEIDSNGSIKHKDGDWELSDSGKLIAENAEIEGEVKATEGHIANWRIQGDRLESDNDNVILDSSGKILAGSISDENYFHWDPTQDIALNMKGRIGGEISEMSLGAISISDRLTIDEDGIIANDGEDDTFILDSNTGAAFFKGHIEAGSGTFAGSLEAASGTFTGDISAATGTFSGSLSEESVTNITDGKYDPEGSASSAESSAKSHADSAASSAESSAKSHADTVASTAEENAKSHADAVASAAEDNAKAYTDGEVDGALFEDTSYDSVYIGSHGIHIGDESEENAGIVINSGGIASKDDSFSINGSTGEAVFKGTLAAGVSTDGIDDKYDSKGSADSAESSAKNHADTNDKEDGSVGGWALSSNTISSLNGNVTLHRDGYIGIGTDSYDNNGIFIGNDGSVDKMSIKSDSNHMKWDGENLIIKGSIGGEISDMTLGELVVSDRLTLTEDGIFATDTEGNETFSLFANTGNAVFAGSLSAASGTFAGDISAASGSFSGEVKVGSGDGQITINDSGISVESGNFELDSNGNLSISGISVSDLDNSNDIVREGDISNFITGSDLDSELSDYITSSDLDSSLSDYTTFSNLNSAISDFIESNEGGNEIYINSDGILVGSSNESNAGLKITNLGMYSLNDKFALDIDSGIFTIGDDDNYLVWNSSGTPNLDIKGSIGGEISEMSLGAISISDRVTIDEDGIIGNDGENDTFVLDANTGNAMFAGTLVAASGSFSGDISAATGTFKDSIEIGPITINEDGLSSDDFTISSNGYATFSGDLDGADGTFSGNLSAAGGTFNGTLSGVDGDFKGDISAATGTFTDSIEIAGITIDEDGLSSEHFTIGSNGNVFLEGEIETTSGNIGSFEIDGENLRSNRDPFNPSYQIDVTKLDSSGNRGYETVGPNIFMNYEYISSNSWKDGGANSTVELKGGNLKLYDYESNSNEVVMLNNGIIHEGRDKFMFKMIDGAKFLDENQNAVIEYDSNSDLYLRPNGINISSGSEFLTVDSNGKISSSASIGGSIALGDLSDVDFSQSPSAGQLLSYENGGWRARPISSGTGLTTSGRTVNLTSSLWEWSGGDLNIKRSVNSGFIKISEDSDTSQAMLELEATSNDGSGATLLEGSISSNTNNRYFMRFYGSSNSLNWAVSTNGTLQEGQIPESKIVDSDGDSIEFLKTSGGTLTDSSNVLTLDSGASPQIDFDLGGTSNSGDYRIYSWGSDRNLGLESMGDVTVVIDYNDNQNSKAFRVRKDGEGSSGDELFAVHEDGRVRKGGHELATENFVNDQLDSFDPDIDISPSDIGALATDGGNSMSGNLNLSGNNLTNIGSLDSTGNLSIRFGTSSRIDISSSFVTMHRTLRPSGNRDLGSTGNPWRNIRYHGSILNDDGEKMFKLEGDTLIINDNE